MKSWQYFIRYPTDLDEIRYRESHNTYLKTRNFWKIGAVKTTFSWRRQWISVCSFHVSLSIRVKFVQDGRTWSSVALWTPTHVRQSCTSAQSVCRGIAKPGDISNGQHTFVQCLYLDIGCTLCHLADLLTFLDDRADGPLVPSQLLNQLADLHTLHGNFL
jgi:hypothetical protein